MNDYIKIDWTEVQAGDVLMHENGDRLTVTDVRRWTANDGRRNIECLAAGQWRFAEGLENNGFTSHRKRPELPTADGTYVSLADWGRRRPSAVTLYSHQPDAPDYGWEWAVSEADGWRKASRDELPDDLVPLVPMPTEEAVREALRVDENPQRRIRRDWAVGRAMSLLEGDTGE